MEQINCNAKPILRWAGGKTWLLKDIHNYLPKKFNNYYEPFIGGGSVYIHLKSIKRIQNEAFLSDQNTDLINTYNMLKKEPNQLIEFLKEFPALMLRVTLDLFFFPMPLSAIALKPMPLSIRIITIILAFFNTEFNFIEQIY